MGYRFSSIMKIGAVKRKTNSQLSTSEQLFLVSVEKFVRTLEKLVGTLQKVQKCSEEWEKTFAATHKLGTRIATLLEIYDECFFKKVFAFFYCTIFLFGFFVLNFTSQGNFFFQQVFLVVLSCRTILSYEHCV